MIYELLVGGSFALAATLGIVAARALCAGLERFADGPQPANPHARVVIAVCALLGAFAASRGLGAGPLAVYALTCGVLSAIWYADLLVGLVPDIFTLVPLGAIAVAAALSHRWDVVVSALVPAFPFAVVAWLSRGRGLGWGDVKLAALGGALMGMQAAVFAYALASVVAIGLTWRRADRTRPIAFAPYLAAAIALPLALFAGH